MRVAIVGCGRMGKVREQGVRAAGGTLIAALDVDRARAEALRPFQVLAEAGDLPWQDLDAVFVCTPPGARGPIERMAIEQGVPLFLEKPIGLSAQFGEELLGALSAKPVLTAVGYHNRYRPGVINLRERITEEEVLGISAHWIAGPYAKPWWMEPAQSGGPVNEQATHMIDLIRYLVPEIEEVSFVGAGNAEGTERCHSWSAHFRLTCGAPCTFIFSCKGSEKQIGINVMTRKAERRLEGWDFHDPTDPQPVHYGQNREEIFYVETQCFLDAIRTSNPGRVRCSLADAQKTQRLVDQAQRLLTSPFQGHSGPCF